ncbi:MAG: ParB/RepB/Spo0J family partition protein [Candidatus Latescibacterota bacterium]|nr:MAG: ParB/RepB/Spo0J family partition protein [Candidatus Latescibacterota bacterium]
MTKRVLGRGLEALLSANPVGEAAPGQTSGVEEIPVHLILPNDSQPRRRFDPDKIAELAESIRLKGVLQPIVVRRRGERFQIVAGERRYLAAKQAGLSRVPVVIREVPDEEMLQWALIENLQRQDLDPIEEAEAFRTLIEEKKITHEEISLLVGRDRTSITNSIRLLQLSEPIVRALGEGRISPGHGRALLQLSSVELRNRLFQKILRDGLSVRRSEELARGPRSPRTKRGTSPAPKRDPEIESLEEKLRLRLGTRVRIRASGKGGVIEIEYYSLEEFERVYSELLAGVEEVTRLGQHNQL